MQEPGQPGIVRRDVPFIQRKQESLNPMAHRLMKGFEGAGLKRAEARS